ncbi:MAG: helix-turn-helix transcriptional regulator [Bacteroidota bacterium]
MEKLNRIKEVLKNQGRSQSWLADQLEVSKNAVNSLCSNRSQPSLKKLNEIADILQVDVCDLLHRNSVESQLTNQSE